MGLENHSNSLCAFSDSDDSEDLENSRKIQEFQEKVS